MLHTVKINNLTIKRTTLLCGLVVAAVFALMPISAGAQCTQWDAGGQWELQQSNGFIYRMDLRQIGKAITGTASYGTTTSGTNVLGVKTGGDPVVRTHNVDGNIEGDDFYVMIGTAGIYRGKVGSSGRMDGTTYDKNKPSSKANWFSSRAMRCVPPPPPPVIPKPIKSSGKAKPAPQTPAPPTPPFIIASQPIITSPYMPYGIVHLGWEGGPDHPNVEVFVSMDSGAEIPAFSMEHSPQSPVWKQPKMSIPLQLQRHHHYRFVLKAAGKTLSTAAFVVP